MPRAAQLLRSCLEAGAALSSPTANSGFGWRGSPLGKRGRSTEKGAGVGGQGSSVVHVPTACQPCRALRPPPILPLGRLHASSGDFPFPARWVSLRSLLNLSGPLFSPLKKGSRSLPAGLRVHR